MVEEADYKQSREQISLSSSETAEKKTTPAFSAAMLALLPPAFSLEH
jgi:hypothetical protein